jgi:spore coat protein CotH
MPYTATPRPASPRVLEASRAITINAVKKSKTLGPVMAMLALFGASAGCGGEGAGKATGGVAGAAGTSGSGGAGGNGGPGGNGGAPTNPAPGTGGRVSVIDAGSSAPVDTSPAVDTMAGVDQAVVNQNNDEIFDPDRLPRFDIDLPPASLEVLRQVTSSMDPRQDTYVRATFRYGAETVSDVGVRIKGEASFRPLTRKSAFKIKFDEFVPGQAFRGLKRITLNNMVEDPTFLAERLAYHFFRAAKLPAPRCNHALVYVNGTFFGVYANVEAEDKPFLRRWFANDAGNLYEEGQRDFVPGAETAFDLETNQTTNDRSDLKSVIATVQTATAATFFTEIGKSIDTAHFVRFTAAEAAVNQWDMYAYTVFYPNNFRIYNDPTSQRLVFLPWGMDMSMKPYRDSGRPHIKVFELARQADRATARVTAGLLFQRCLESAACKAALATAVTDIAREFEAAGLAALAERYYTQIRPHALMDTRKEHTNQAFEAGYQALLRTIRERPAALRADVAAAR